MGGDHLWEAVGAIAEALGAAGVIGTLVYLAVQVRQNTHTIQSNDQRLPEDAPASSKRCRKR